MGVGPHAREVPVRDLAAVQVRRWRWDARARVVRVAAGTRLGRPRGGRRRRGGRGPGSCRTDPASWCCRGRVAPRVRAGRLGRSSGHGGTGPRTGSARRRRRRPWRVRCGRARSSPSRSRRYGPARRRRQEAGVAVPGVLCRVGDEPDPLSDRQQTLRSGRGGGPEALHGRARGTCLGRVDADQADGRLEARTSTVIVSPSTTSETVPRSVRAPAVGTAVRTATAASTTPMYRRPLNRRAAPARGPSSRPRPPPSSSAADQLRAEGLRRVRVATFLGSRAGLLEDPGCVPPGAHERPRRRGLSMGVTGLEPVTPSLSSWCSPN